MFFAACDDTGDRDARDAGDTSRDTTDDPTDDPTDETGTSGGTDDPTDADDDAATDDAYDPFGTTGFLSPPAGFPRPVIPADNPLTEASAELGRRLFYDVRLSGNETQSCASCHDQSRAFTDGRATALGSTNEVHRRNAMSLTNVLYNSAQTWANPLLVELERQALVPIFGESPVELGMSGREDELVARLRADETYQALFPQAFPHDDDPFDIEHVAKAIASFERTLISGNSAYDRFVYQGESDALSDSARRGMDLFFSERMECFHCHGGFNFTGSIRFDHQASDELNFQNNGLYNVDGKGAYPARDQGLVEVTLDPADMGRFRAPTLRNIAVTAPYMHDGSIASLEDVLDHYARGGRLISEGPDAGDGSQSPLRSIFLPGFELTESERNDVVEFLKSLTDEAFLTDPRFSDPFKAP